MRGGDPKIRSLLGRIAAEEGTQDPTTALLASILGEFDRLSDKLDAAEKRRQPQNGGGGGIGNGRFALFRDLVVIVIIPLGFALGAFVVNINERVARIEETRFTPVDAAQLERRLREDRREEHRVIEERLDGLENRERDGR